MDLGGYPVLTLMVRAFASSLVGSFRTRRIRRGAAVLAACLLLGSVRALAQQAAPTRAAQSPATVQAIPASEVVERAEYLKRALRRVESQLAGSPTVSEFDQQLNRRGRELHRSALETDELLSATPSLLDLREQERYWTYEVGSSLRFQEQLTGRTAALGREVRSLERLQATWEATHASVKTESELEALAERIASALAAIQATKAHAQSQVDQLVELQTRVAEQQSLASEMVDDIEAALARSRRQLFERSSPSFWEAAWRQKSERRREGRRAWAQRLALSKEFLRRNSLAMAGLLLLFLALLMTAFTWRRKAPGWIEQQRISEASARILRRPISLALLLTLTPAMPALVRSPVLVNFVVFLVLMIATIRLVPLLIGSSFQPFLYTLLAFYLLVMLRLVTTTPFVERTAYALSSLVVLVVFGWLTRRALVKGLTFQGQGGRRLLLALRGGLILLGLCCLLNLIGYFALARTMQDVLEYTTCLGIVLYFAFRVVTIFVSILLEADRARSIATIRLREKEILRWATPFLAVVACIFWLDITLDTLTLRVQALKMVDQALSGSIELGKVPPFSLGDVLTFILVLVAGFALARLVRFFLLQDVFSRLEMERGLPEVISTTIYYLLVMGVFALALSAAGVGFSRFNVLTGAFGLGIGFGLQTVISNFVSGLIVKYERRINVGDTVELSGGLSGVVRKVGIRASIIATSDGAEAIVPNSLLVTNQVINWTLSSPKRRAVLLVGVAYETDPERVIGLLVEVASSHPEVLHDPAPAVLVLGFGDKVLNFELSFWTPSVNLFGRLRSEVTLAVCAALAKAGIEIKK